MVVAAAAAFAIFVMMAAAAAALALIVMMVAPAAAFTFFVMVAAAAATLALIVVMVMSSAAAFTFFVMMAAAAAAPVLIVVMVMASAAATLAVAVVVTVSAAAASAAAVAGQGHGNEGLMGFGDGEADVFKKLAQLLNGDDGKAVFGRRNAKTAGGEGVDGLLHERGFARHLENILGCGLNLVEASFLVDQNVPHFERAHLSQGVFNRLTGGRERLREFDALGHRERNALCAVHDALSRGAVKRKEFGDSHSFL